MRELGEGMRRIFELMKSSELAQPEISNEAGSFSLTLHHRPMYAKDEALWLEQYDSLSLSAEEKATILMGRRGDLISPNDIIRRLGIVDTEHYRQVVYSLQTKGVLETAIRKSKAQNVARRKRIGIRDVARFIVKPVKDIGSARDRLRAEAPKSVKRVSVDKADVETIGSENRALYVGNLPLNTTERDIVRAFEGYGSIAAVFLPRYGNLHRGYAFVEFEEAEKAQSALRAEISFGGRKLVIRWKRPQIRR
jgi:ATP-dependent DNA helicase RecG